MTGHRVELRVSFTCNSREGAEGVLERLEYANSSGEFNEYASNFEVTKSTVDGNGWEEKWPAKCAARLYIPRLYGNLAVPVSGEVHWLPCDIPPSEKHPIVKDPTARTEWTHVHRAGAVWWADGNVPRDEEDDDD